MQNYKGQRNWWTIGVGVLFIVMAIAIYAQPLSTLVSLSYLFGILALIHAAVVGYEVWSDRKMAQSSSGWWLATVILDVVIAVLFIGHVGVGVSVIGIFFAIWFIWDAIFEIYMDRAVRDLSRGMAFWTTVLGCLSVFFGFLMLFSPVLAASVMVWLIAFYLFFFGVLTIARSL